MTQTKSQLLALLLQNAYKKGTFTLSSGRQSDFYIDVKKVALSGLGHPLIGTSIVEHLIAKHSTMFANNINAVAGVELGGCPLASAVATIFKIPAIYVRKATKEHGTGRLVEVPYDVSVGANVVLLEDVVTTGASTLRAVSSLMGAGFRVTDVVAVIDRQEGGAKAISKEVPFSSLFTREDFVG
ncbi:MAG: orotate phosphoribosyltransferase [Planctomycetota bacterium]|jgi:orotate phosphoribosyltransferase